MATAIVENGSIILNEAVRNGERDRTRILEAPDSCLVSSNLEFHSARPSCGTVRLFNWHRQFYAFLDGQFDTLLNYLGGISRIFLCRGRYVYNTEDAICGLLRLLNLP